jgi:hypothetical protein
MRYALIAIVVAACTDAPPFVEPDPVVQTHVDTYELYGQFPRTVDVLIVVGDLGGRDITKLATTFEELMPTWFDGFTNIRIATTSSSDVLEMSTDILGHHTQNFDGSLGDALAPRLTPGSTGVLARALATATTFTQERHYLGIVLVTATDDTSPTADYAHALKSPKSDPADVWIAGIYGEPTPKLDAVSAAFQHRSTRTSIDAADYAPAFELFQYMQRVIIPLPCFTLPFDLDPETPGEQIDYTVSAWSKDGVELAKLPRCAGGDPETGSCWDIVPDPNCNILPTDPPRGVTRLRGLWRLWRPVTHWECATK